MSVLSVPVWIYVFISAHTFSTKSDRDDDVVDVEDHDDLNGKQDKFFLQLSTCEFLSLLAHIIVQPRQPLIMIIKMVMMILMLDKGY